MPRTLDFSPLIDPDTGDRYLPVAVRGSRLLMNPLLNKGTAFTRDERVAFGLTGYLPDHISTIEEQIERIHDQLRYKTTAMEKNIHLNSLLDRNETLFYRYVVDHLEETVPIIYTPTVANACAHWSRIFRRARGVYVTPRNRGHIAEVLASRPVGAAPVIVATDNERILGIGDQGAGGMGIPIGKLALYTAGAGIHPGRTVPVSLDFGTDNAELLADPLYLGYSAHRVRGEDYDGLIAEFVEAVKQVYPRALLQWEDFSNRTSFHNLEAFRNVIPSFNDDIQGTAAMVVGGLLAACRHNGSRMAEQRVVIVGAGSAGVGIRDQITMAMVADGATRAEAHRQILVLDSRGLIIEGRSDLSAVKQTLAVPADSIAGWEIEGQPICLDDVVRNARATVLIGVSGVPGVFGEQVIRRMADHTAVPIIMPLSNPTSHAEVTPAAALEWTDGRAIVATGSPFAPVTYDGEQHRIGQANNMFIFPGLGLGAVTVGATEISDGMFLAAARALADEVEETDLANGQIYPSITRVRDVSWHVAKAVAEAAISEGLALPVEDLDGALAANMWEPEYLPYRPV